MKRTTSVLIFVGFVIAGASLVFFGSRLLSDEPSAAAKPPSPDEVDLRVEFSRADQAWLVEKLATVPMLLQWSDSAPDSPDECISAAEGSVTISIRVRADLAAVESTELRGMVLNHSSAIWSYLVVCARGGEDGGVLLDEISFYEAALAEWARS